MGSGEPLRIPEHSSFPLCQQGTAGVFPSRLPLPPPPPSPAPGFATGVILWCLDEQIFLNPQKTPVSLLLESSTMQEGGPYVPGPLGSGRSQFWTKSTWVSWLFPVCNLGSPGCLPVFALMGGIKQEGGGGG